MIAELAAVAAIREMIVPAAGTASDIATGDLADFAALFFAAPVLDTAFLACPAMTPSSPICGELAYTLR
ncbi:MAG: hypothetical protein ABJA75_25165 [Bradyrhizobium sp.]